MKVGDYVRTEGIITKVKHCCSDKDNWYFTFDLANGCEMGATLTKRYKTSPNIIDLIEVGDYVNGEKVVDKFNYLLAFGEGQDGNWYIRDDEIKSIVTKEQFEAMKYEIK